MPLRFQSDRAVTTVVDLLAQRLYELGGTPYVVQTVLLMLERSLAHSLFSAPSTGGDDFRNGCEDGEIDRLLPIEEMISHAVQLANQGNIAMAQAEIKAMPLAYATQRGSSQRFIPQSLSDDERRVLEVLQVSAPLDAFQVSSRTYLPPAGADKALLRLRRLGLVYAENLSDIQSGQRILYSSAVES